MSRIKTIGATNLKGTSFRYELEAVNVICGDNFCGKTAVLSAVRLALMGYEPALGKLPGATFAACGNNSGGATSLLVSAKLAGSDTIEREWTMKSGRVSYYGPDREYIPMLLLDPTAYFDMTGPARLNYVLGQCDANLLRIDHESVVKVLNDSIKPEGAEEQAAYAGLLDSIKALEQSRIEEDVGLYDWVTAVVDDLKGKATAATALAKTHEQTVRGLTTAKSTDGTMEAVASVQPEINKATAKQLEAAGRAATVKAKLEQATLELSKAQAQVAKRIDPVAMEAALKRSQEAIIEHGKVANPGKRPDVPETPKLAPVEKETKACAVANARMTEVVTAARDLEREHAQLLKHIEQVEAQDCCPTCNQNMEAVKKVVLPPLRAKAKQLSEQHAQALKQVEQVETVLKERTKALEQVQQHNLRIEQADAKEWETYHQAARNWDVLNDGYNKAQEGIRAAEKVIAGHADQVRFNADVDVAAASVPKLEKVLKELSDEAVAADCEVQAIRLELEGLNLKQRKFIAATQDARRVDQCQTEFKAATATATIYKAALKVLEVEKVKAATRAFEAIVFNANKFTSGILKAPLEYRDGDLGMTYKGNWIGHKAFSGTEALLAFAGLSVALTCKSDAAVRLVLMDELGRLDEANKTKLCQRMLSLVEDGAIDQFIGVDIDADALVWREAGANVIKVASQPKAGKL